MSLRPESPVVAIDAKVARRRAGYRTKGPEAHEVLREAFGIATVGQLLRHYPRRYIDRSQTASIRDLRAAVATSRQPTLEGREPPRIRAGDQVTVIGRVARVDSRRTRRGQPMVTVVVNDGTGPLDLPYFNQPWISRSIRPGMELAVSGRVGLYAGRVQLQNQEVEVLRGDDADPVHTGRIIPVHPASDGITARTIRELVHGALAGLGPVPEPFDRGIVRAERLAPEARAIRDIHFPVDRAALRAARERLKFDELFALELGVAFRKRRLERTARGVSHDLDPGLAQAFVGSLPFAPTAAQRRAMAEIAADMAAPRPMNRLLQGDVGAGKTAVALYAAMVAVQSGHQAVIMAPTEVLAGQHARNAAALLAGVGGRRLVDLPAPVRAAATPQASLFDDAPSPAGGPAGSGSAPADPAAGPVFALLTASVTGKERRRVLEGAADGSVDVLIGTHALVQEGVAFADLSLAVVDEQHRFGVHQRVRLKEKGAREEGGYPDVLIMTATPIPRTLALTYYGDLDVSVLDELPAGRQPVTTRVVRGEDGRRAAYALVRDEVAAGRQAFVVCAAIDEANAREARAAEAEAERLRGDVFPDLADRILLLHGRMRPADKERVMEAFRTGEAGILITTTVVEVGVDVPNATVMMVENAERFGLAQLHQLRGRIGRGAHAGHCVLVDESGDDGGEARARLQALVRTTDGFVLADEDLRLRGEGTLFDIRQSGMPDLRLARLAADADLVRRARDRAFAVVGQDEHLADHPELLRLLRDTFSGEAIEWLFHG